MRLETYTRKSLEMNAHYVATVWQGLGPLGAFWILC